jgi:hypothetical protein
MVDMKMCANDAIDRFAGTSDLLQVLQEGQLQLVPFGIRTHLVVSDAGIDDDALAL